MAALVGAFFVGRLTAAPAAYPVYSWSAPTLALAQYSHDPNDPRELIPLPGQGAPDQALPQPGGQPNECPLYFYQDGQLFQMPGQAPDGPLGQGNPELFPLEPVPPPGGPPSDGSAPSPVPPRPVPPQQPEEPFFRSPGVAASPLRGPLLVTDRSEGSVIVSRLPGR